MACVIAILAECASMYPTAGGAYHFAIFLVPEKFRRGVGYPLGWINYFGWVFTAAACSSIGGNLTIGLINLCLPTFDATIRWRLFMIYLGWASVSFLLNQFLVSVMSLIENVGCKSSFIPASCHQLIQFAKVASAWQVLLLSSLPFWRRPRRRLHHSSLLRFLIKLGKELNELSLESR